MKILIFSSGRLQISRHISVVDTYPSARKAIRKGMIEPEDMPHAETLRIMELLDSLRKEWGVIFPSDKL